MIKFTLFLLAFSGHGRAVLLCSRRLQNDEESQQRGSRWNEVCLEGNRWKGAERNRSGRLRNSFTRRRTPVHILKEGTHVVDQKALDATITAAVKMRLANDERVSATRINVDTKDGIVTCEAQSQVRVKPKLPSNSLNWWKV